jgi:hypothetical protein
VNGFWQCVVTVDPDGSARQLFHYFDDRGCFLRTEVVPPDGWVVDAPVVTVAGARLGGVSESRGRQFESDQLRPRPGQGFRHLSETGELVVDEAWGQMLQNALDPAVTQPGPPFVHTLTGPRRRRRWWGLRRLRRF